MGRLRGGLLPSLRPSLRRRSRHLERPGQRMRARLWVRHKGARGHGCNAGPVVTLSPPPPPAEAPTAADGPPQAGERQLAGAPKVPDVAIQQEKGRPRTRRRARQRGMWVCGGHPGPPTPPSVSLLPPLSGTWPREIRFPPAVPSAAARLGAYGAGERQNRGGGSGPWKFAPPRCLCGRCRAPNVPEWIAGAVGRFFARRPPRLLTTKQSGRNSR